MVACPAGSYSATTGASACTTCQAGFSATTGTTACVAELCTNGYSASGWAPCTACPTGTGRVCGTGGWCRELTDCRCNLATYGPDGGPCTPCTPNSGSTCGPPTNINERCNDISGCSCNAGYSGNFLSCIACKAHGCRYNERLNAETGGSKTPRTHWVVRVNI